MCGIGVRTPFNFKLFQCAEKPQCFIHTVGLHQLAAGTPAARLARSAPTWPAGRIVSSHSAGLFKKTVLFLSFPYMFVSSLSLQNDHSFLSKNGQQVPLLLTCSSSPRPPRKLLLKVCSRRQSGSSIKAYSANVLQPLRGASTCASTNSWC